MSRQALGQAMCTVVRRVGLGVLLGIAGAFAVTLLSWMASSMAASADEEPAPPLVNVVDTGDPLGLVNDTVHDAVRDTVETVSTKVMPPEPKAVTSAEPLVTDSLGQTLRHVGKTVGSLVPEPKHAPVRTTDTVRKPATPAAVPSPPPEKHVITPPVRRPPVPVQATGPLHQAPPAAETHQPAPGDHQPEGPAAPASPWGVPSAPASNSAGTGFHSPDTPAFEGSASPFWTGRTLYRPLLRSTCPVVFRTVNAQPGVTPD
ncbi:MAG TPA: hypothetical protein VHC18_13310 [Amycolatopsis sp.]|nr:hypothetical protein [Amycolatopsis sp.]